MIALLEDPRVTVELITDGVHVDPALYRHVARSAGTGPGVADHRRDGRRPGWPTAVIGLGRWPWMSSTGWPEWPDTDTIAGSTATMDHQFRFAVDHSGLAP